MVDTVAQLSTAIQAEASVLQRFIDVLQEEQKLLIGGDAEAILPLMDQKADLVAQLGAAGQQREAALQALGVKSERDDVEGFFAAAAASVQGQWSQLIALAQQAQQLNTTNGKLINTRLQHNQQALSVLMNAAGDIGGNVTYGPDGQQKHGAGSRNLGSA